MTSGTTAVVTGASTGIGHAAATALAGRGWTVWAGVRNEDDAARVAEDGLHPVMLDVTDPAQVERAASTVLSDGGIDVLVNNAGVGAASPIETLSDELLQHLFDVNVHGLHRVTRTFLPAIIESRGRVINVSSIAGRLALPFMGAYAASKHAVEALSDALRREVGHLNVRVAVIEPGVVTTPIWTKATDLSVDPESLPPHYKTLAERMLGRVEQVGEHGISPEEVADAIVHAATSPFPRNRYALPLPERVAARVAQALPERVSDLLVRAGVALRS